MISIFGQKISNFVFGDFWFFGDQFWFLEILVKLSFFKPILNFLY